MKFSLLLVGCVAACGTASAPDSESQTSQRAQVASAPAVAATPAAITGDAADSSCQLVLRTAYVPTQNDAPQTSCASGTCFAVVTGTFDVANASANATPLLLFQSAVDQTWHTAQTTPIWGAGLGYRRYEFTLNDYTFLIGSGTQTLHFIPYLNEVSGARLFDHNRVTDPAAAYALTAAAQIQADATCAASAPHGIQTLVFAQGWQNSGYGNLVQNGKLDINYDIYRIPSGLSCTTDGVRAAAVTAYVHFSPGGEQQQERIDGVAGTTGTIASLPLEFDVPADATSAALWFLDSSDCNGNQWDSNFGANYNYAVAAQ